MGVSFLHDITVGTITNPNDPGFNVLSVTSTAAGDFDKGNLVSDILRQVWRSTSTALQEIVIQSEIAVEIDTFAILGHNFSDAAVITLQANTLNDFTAPPFSFIIPVTPKNMVFTQTIGAAYQYWKIKILDPGNPCGYIEIGRIAGGLAFTFDDNCEDITDDFTIGYQDKGQKLSSEGFSRPANDKILIRTVSARFAKLSTNVSTGPNDNYLGLVEMIENVRTTRPFVTILDRGNPTLFTGWTEFVSLPQFSYSINGYVTANLDLEETF